jgi:hypothetical protein
MSVPADKPVMWEVLVHLLQDHGPGADAVVRFTAATVVKTCVDVSTIVICVSPLLRNYPQTIGFDVNVFTPYLAPVVSELLKLLAEADTTDGKLRIISSLNAVIQNTGQSAVSLIYLFGDTDLIGLVDPSFGAKHHEASPSIL